MKASNKEIQDQITPEIALRLLKEGNVRYQQNKREPQNFTHQINSTSRGQFPFATILSCIDSRVPTELIFDQGLGDLFSIRVAGNIINDDVIGSMEFGTEIASVRLIVVLGHTGCGAVKGACDDVQLGELTGLLAKIKPAINLAGGVQDTEEYRNYVSKVNVERSLSEIRTRSKILRTKVESGNLYIIGAMYDIATGAVEFYV